MLKILHLIDSKSVRCENVRLFTSKLNLNINVDSDMFNRVREVNRMTQLLTGPVNSRKSRLVEYVIDKLEKDMTSLCRCIQLI